MSRRPLRLGALGAVLVGAFLVVLGFTAGGGGGAFDEASSKLSGAVGPRLEIASIGVAVDLRGGTVNADGRVNPPARTAMWLQGYDRVRPGAVGTAVVAGHLEHSGAKDVFARLPELRVGDRFALVAGDADLTFEVTRTDVVDKVELTGDDTVWGPNTSSRRIVLITCDDELGYRKDGHRVANYVVVAEAA
ncbi:class F sortase [Knoellia subterranea]|uniref:Peptidase C60 n=1 Tax=Knoellia subterranea KCTC 19937 TaxID=1385521 RepID=A0A0A0JFW0_9MICO|nr:class F sortase [Knoellia subterranea]KGN36340.1 hypothetical protein N803_05920 [Knoellia subterranea KCTC 19937]